VTIATCSMCPRPIGRTVTGLCGHCVRHKCRPESADRIRAKRTADYWAQQRAKITSSDMERWRAELDARYAPVGLPGWSALVRGARP